MKPSEQIRSAQAKIAANQPWLSREVTFELALLQWLDDVDAKSEAFDLEMSRTMRDRPIGPPPIIIPPPPKAK